MNKNKKSTQPARRRSAPLPIGPILMISGGLALLGMVIYAVWQATPGANTGPTVPVAVNGAPSLKPDKEKVDLGNVRLGQTVKVEFQIANVGDRQLRLTEAPYVEVVEGC